MSTLERVLLVVAAVLAIVLAGAIVVAAVLGIIAVGVAVAIILALAVFFFAVGLIFDRLRSAASRLVARVAFRGTCEAAVRPGRSA